MPQGESLLHESCLVADFALLRKLQLIKSLIWQKSGEDSGQNLPQLL